MPGSSFELFRFAVIRAPREDLPKMGIDAPETTSFVTIALERAAETPRPTLGKVAEDWLSGKNAIPYSANTPIIQTAADAINRLHAFLASSEESTPDKVVLAIKEAGFVEARGNKNHESLLDKLWSTLTALHCTGAGDVGAVLGLSRALRVLIAEISTYQKGEVDLARLLRGTLKLPLGAVREAYMEQPNQTQEPRPLPLNEELRILQRAEGQKLITLQSTLDKIKRIEHNRSNAAKPLKNSAVKLTPTEIKALSLEESNVLLNLGVRSAPIASVIAELQIAANLHVNRVANIGQPVYKPPVKVLKSKLDEANETRTALLQLSHHSMGMAFMENLKRPGVIDALVPDIWLRPPTDEMVEGLKPRIRPLGVLDLKRVETKLKGYWLGELAHIENVLATEYRQRKHSRQETFEETTQLEKQTLRENERNLESTERFQMQQEVTNTINEQMQVTAGVRVSVNGPTFSVGANVGFGYNRSTEQAQKFSSDYSKEIVEKTRERVETKVREVRQTLRRVTVKEGNVHSFDNTGADSTHKVGVYRYVDRVLEAKLMNYGRRMMFEFMVPEPAAILRSVERQTSSKPTALPELTITPKDLDASNYQDYAGLYGAREIDPPPPERTAVSALLSRNNSSPPGDGTTAATILLSGEIDIPEGYAVYGFRFKLGSSGDTTPVVYNWAVGDYRSIFNNLTTMTPLIYFGAPMLAAKIPVWFLVGQTIQAIASVTLECQRQTQRWEKWQNDTFMKIKEAYELRLADILDANRRLESQQRRGISGQNPANNRRREREELIRGCINAINSMLLQGDYFDSLSVTDSDVVVDVDDALREGQTVRFFHTAFEWDNMTYELYPYFWGNRKRWAEMMLATHEDSKFEEFLRSGFARVMVPVQPGQETNVLNFLSLGLKAVFDGASETIIDDSEFMSLLAELKEPLYPPIQEGEAWEVIVPTTLVKLQLPGEEEWGIRGTA